MLSGSKDHRSPALSERLRQGSQVGIAAPDRLIDFADGTVGRSALKRELTRAFLGYLGVKQEETANHP
jgi:hypothetical protein